MNAPPSVWQVLLSKVCHFCTLHNLLKNKRLMEDKKVRGGGGEDRL